MVDNRDDILRIEVSQVDHRVFKRESSICLVLFIDDMTQFFMYVCSKVW